jgi:hypothetical protein
MKRLLFMLLCIVIVLTASCSPKSEETVSGEQNNAQDIPGLAETYDMPPELLIVDGGWEYTLSLGSYNWPGGDGITEGEMPWPPVLPDRPVIIDHDKGDISIGFRADGDRPQSIKVRLIDAEALYFDDKQAMVEYDSIEIDGQSLADTGNGFAFDYSMPSSGIDVVNKKYVIEVEMIWPDQGQGSRDATYYGRLWRIPKNDVDQVTETVLGLHGSLWDGDKDKAAAYMTQTFINMAQTGGSMDFSSFASVYESSGWDLLMWQDGQREFNITGQLDVEVIHIGPEQDGPYAEVVVIYPAEVTEGGSIQLCKFREHYGLQREDGAWKVFRIERRAKPVSPKTGQVGLDTTIEKEGRLLCIGPFTYVNLYKGMGSPGGPYAAFAADNSGMQELWAGRVDNGNFDKIFELKTVDSLEYQVRNDITILSVDDDGKVTFLVNGNITTGPYKGRQGFWVAEKAIGDPQAKSLAFVPAARADYYNSNYIGNNYIGLTDCSA